MTSSQIAIIMMNSDQMAHDNMLLSNTILRKHKNSCVICNSSEYILKKVHDHNKAAKIWLYRTPFYVLSGQVALLLTCISIRHNIGN